MKGKIWTNLLALIAALCLCFGLAACGENGGNGSQGDETSDPLVGVWTSEIQGTVMEISIAEQDGDLYFVMVNKVGGIMKLAAGGEVEDIWLYYQTEKNSGWSDSRRVSFSEFCTRGFPIGEGTTITMVVNI